MSFSIEWLGIKETLVPHLLNLTVSGADYLRFASLLVIVKSARLGESPSTQVASVRPFPRVSSAMSPERGNIGETSPATSTRVRLLPSVGSLVQLQVGLPRKSLLTLVALERLQTRVDQHVLCKFAWSLEHRLALRAFVHRFLWFGFLWQRFI